MHRAVERNGPRLLQNKTTEVKENPSLTRAVLQQLNTGGILQTVQYFSPWHICSPGCSEG